MRLRRYIRVAVMGWFLFLVGTAQAGGPGFVETGLGIDQMIGGKPYFEDAPGVSGFGSQLSLAIGLDTSHWYRRPKPIWVHFGVWAQLDMMSNALSNGTLNSLNFGALYPFARVHVKQVFLTVGGSPFLFSSEGVDASLTGMKMKTSFIGLLVQAGYEWEITPEVSMLFAGQNQTAFRGKAGPSPSALYAATLSFRFFLFPDSSWKRRRRYYGEDEDPYPGWRYPYGWPLH